MANPSEVVSITIASGETVSGAFYAADAAHVAVELPATFTGTTLTFQVSTDNTTFQVLRDFQGNVVTAIVTQGVSYDLPEELVGWHYLKIVSGTAEGAARTLKVVLRK